MKRFITGFTCGALAVGLANLVSHLVRSSPPEMMDGIQIYGFPFVVLRKGGLPGFDEFSYAALWIDLLTVVLCGTVTGILFARRGVNSSRTGG
jgi:hypothetical protein